MGQGHNHSLHRPLDQTWAPLKRDSSALFTNVNPYAKRILCNKINNEQVEEYHLQFPSEEEFKVYTQQLRIRMESAQSNGIVQNTAEYYFNLSPHIYTVKHFINTTQQDICSTIYKGLLYAQKVDLRLKEINDIPYQDILYLTKATLSGFKVLYEKVGYFDISEEMIFITKEGKVKVWLNSNLSKNEPIFIPSSAYRQFHGSQSDMIVQLLDLIEQNSDNRNNNTMHFREYLIRKRIYNRLSFFRAVQEFEVYCKEHRQLVDNFMRAVSQLYQLEQPEYSQAVDHTSSRHKEYLPRNAPRQSHYQPSLPRKSVYRNSVQSFKLNNNNQDSYISRTREGSEYQPRLTHHESRSGLRPKAISNRLEKIPQLALKSNQESYQYRPSHKLNHNSTSVTSIVYPRYYAPVREEHRPPQPPLRYGMLNNIPRKSQNFSISHEGMHSDRSQPKTIRFNYVQPNIPPEPSFAKQRAPYMMPSAGKNLTSIHYVPTESIAQIKEQSPFQSQHTKQSNNMKYYTPEEMYMLDKEIADDMEKFLDFSRQK